MCLVPFLKYNDCLIVEEMWKIYLPRENWYIVKKVNKF